MKRAATLILLALLPVLLPACAAPPEDPPTPLPLGPTFTAAPPTPTIVWFPPSETPTGQALPTHGPTPERKPGVGKLLLTDNFVSSTSWNAGTSEDATIEVGRGRLTIAVQPGVSAFRIRQGPALSSFYAEITAQPSLCRDRDEYGLLFRAPNNIAYYSFTLLCNGTARAERVKQGRVYPLQPAIASADSPVGPPEQVRIGVWASGPELRFFLNGRYQFGVSDKTLASGALGVFAHATGSTPVTVIFSELSIFNVTYVPPSATPTP